jgi:glycosyltransferase involved in cell wall biosynthesis
MLGGTFLPINYPITNQWGTYSRPGVKGFDVGCFGSIRPLKNHVGQLLALGAARGHIKQPHVYFHINSTRIEGTGFILTELEELARELDIHLVKHDWIPTETFKSDIIPSMDLGLFGSFAESFCLTAADFVAAGVPSVLSSHIPWASGCDTDTEALTSAIVGVLEDPGWTAAKNLKDLRKYSANAAKSWQCALEKGVYAAY